METINKDGDVSASRLQNWSFWILFQSFYCWRVLIKSAPPKKKKKKKKTLEVKEKKKKHFFSLFLFLSHSLSFYSLSFSFSLSLSLYFSLFSFHSVFFLSPKCLWSLIDIFRFPRDLTIYKIMADTAISLSRSFPVDFNKGEKQVIKFVESNPFLKHIKRATEARK